MKTVRAGFRDQTDLAESRLAQVRRIRVGLHLEFLYGVNRGLHGNVAELARIVAGAVKREIVLAVAASDHDSRAVAASGRSHGRIETAGPRRGSRREQ